jgi:hypothetical protein
MKTSHIFNTLFVLLVAAIISVVAFHCTQPNQAPKLDAPIVETGAPSYPATEISELEARTIAANDPSYSVIQYSKVTHIIKVGKGTLMPNGSYAIDYGTLERAAQVTPGDGGPSDPSCDCDNGSHSWQCNCDPKHKILIVGVPDCCAGYCGVYGILLWCSGGCTSKVATCGDAFPQR